MTSTNLYHFFRLKSNIGKTVSTTIVVTVLTLTFVLLPTGTAVGAPLDTLQPPSSTAIDRAKNEIIKLEGELQDITGVSETTAAQLTVVNSEKATQNIEYQKVLETLKEQEEKLSGYANKLYTEGELFRTADLSQIALLTEGPSSVAQLSRNQQFSEQFGGKDVQKLKQLHEDREGVEERIENLTQEKEELTNALIARNESIVEKTTELENARLQLDRELEQYTAELLEYSCAVERESVRKNIETRAQYQSATFNLATAGENREVPPPPATQFTSGTQIINGKKIWDFFTVRGFTPEATAGILGNLDQESRFNPAITQQPSGPGRGLAQWSAGGRWDTSRPNLVDYAESIQASPWAITTQLEFMLLEMSIGWGGFDMESFKKETDILKATEYFHKVYERSADSAEFVRRVRGGNAEKWHTLFKDTTTRDSSTPEQGDTLSGSAFSGGGGETFSENDFLSPECRTLP